MDFTPYIIIISDILEMIFIQKRGLLDDIHLKALFPSAIIIIF